MKQILLSLALAISASLAIVAPASAQNVLGNYKNKVDTSIVNKTAASSITRQAIGGRMKELADIVQGVNDSVLHSRDTLTRIATWSKVNTLIYQYLTALPGFADGAVLSVQGSNLIWLVMAEVITGDFNNDFNNDFSIH